MTTAEPRLRVHIRWMIRRDMPEVLAIDADGFVEPWGEDRFLAVLRRRDCVGLVAEAGERIVGFAVYQLREKSIRVLGLATHAGFRRRGVGRQMAAKLAGKLSPSGRVRIKVDVPEDSDSWPFWRAMGYRAELVRGDERDLYRFTYAGNGELP